MKSKIYFFEENINFKLKEKLKIKAWLNCISDIEEKEILTLNYVFCNDGYLLNLNQNFLKHNTFTDIITFQNNEIGKPIDGEIYISIDRVIENAKIHNSRFEIELKRVLAHGLLHLCGYKDKTNSQIELMRSKEEDALILYENLI